jgi:superoxide dismutase, Cu-Zn family
MELMKTGLVLLMTISAVLMFATTVNAQENTTYNATAVMKDANGTIIGLATFTQGSSGPVHITVSVSGLMPGLHGTHIHDKGICIGPSFTSAGGHYNPLGKEHGFLNPKGPHAGDLPNPRGGRGWQGKYECYNQACDTIIRANHAIYSQ